MRELRPVRITAGAFLWLNGMLLWAVLMAWSTAKTLERIAAALERAHPAPNATENR